jgi:hypothetical protein
MIRKRAKTGSNGQKLRHAIGLKKTAITDLQSVSEPDLNLITPGSQPLFKTVC